MISVANFVTRVINESGILSHYDITTGSNVYELIIEPITQILEEVLENDVITGLSNRLSLSDPDVLELEDLIKLAANNLIIYRDPNQTSGFIRLVFLNNDLSYKIPAETELTSGDITFTIPDRMAISSANLVLVGGVYKSLPIYVYNADGENIEANTLWGLPNPPTTLIRIEHVAFTNGSVALDEADMLNVVKGSIYNRQLIGYASIYSSITQLTPGITHLIIIGPEDEEMTRDEYFDVRRITEDYSYSAQFIGKVKGDYNSNDNAAYKIFWDGENMPEPAFIFTELLANELETEDYTAISRLAGNALLVSTDIIFEDDFDYEWVVPLVDLEAIERNSYIATPAGAEELPDIFRAGKVILIESLDNEGEVIASSYHVIKSIEEDVIMFYGPFVEAIAIPRMVGISQSMYEIPGNWYKSEDGQNINDPGFTYDYSLHPLSSSLVSSGEGNALQLGIYNPIYEAVEGLSRLGDMGLENLEDAVAAALVPKLITLIYPSNTNIVPETENVTVLFRWAQTTCSYYEFEMRWSPYFTGGSWVAVFPETTIERDVDNPFLKLVIPENKQYWWRVRGMSEGGNTAWVYGSFVISRFTATPSTPNTQLEGEF